VIVLGIDPGPETSGVVWFDTEDRCVIEASGDMPNDEALSTFRRTPGFLKAPVQAYACECIEAMYAHVGKETVRTIRFCGAIEEAVVSRGHPIAMLSPQEVKKRVCGTASAKDPAVRQALIDLLGPVGTKKNPGPCFGVSKHAWRALAVAVAATIKADA
jgi:Holliday junction resolvasome RuvABC endonuclease subunit